MFTVEFKDKKWALLETDEAHKTGLPEAIIQSCRRKLNFLRNAKDERDLWNFKSLRYEKLKGDREGQRSIRLNDQWRVLLEVSSSNPPTITILDIEDYH